jgi:2-polyprenyl-6-methoxyphenol hydroxylase-like FAD-dependent oxidoreductase
MYSIDVLVLGGGPAGLAAAIAAARRGMRVTLADAARPPIDKACGEGLMPDSLVAAAKIGITIPGRLGSPFRGICFTSGNHIATTDFPAGLGLGVRRTVLHEWLTSAAAAAGVQLLHGVPFTGMDASAVRLGSVTMHARWIVGADGMQSSVRRSAGLDQFRRKTLRFGFRQHFRVAPWSEFIEIHWGNGCQFYITPISPDEVCLALMSRDPHLRVREALREFPELEHRFPERLASTTERGSPAGTRRLKRVSHANIALAGDASGNVDAIAGEGLCLAFQQAESLALALEAGNLESYEKAHRASMRWPVFMADLMLTLDRSPALRRRALPVLARRPDILKNLLSLHAGEADLPELTSAAAALCWGVLLQ